MPLTISDMLKPGGSGVIATANANCVPNAAIYARPNFVDENIVAWGMTKGRTYRNLKENPNAAFLYIEPGHGYRGVRLLLKLKEIRDSGEMLEQIKAKTASIVGQKGADAVKYVAFFNVIEIRPLI